MFNIVWGRSRPTLLLSLGKYQHSWPLLLAWAATGNYTLAGKNSFESLLLYVRDLFFPSFFFMYMSREGTSYKGLYGGAPPERGTFVRLKVYEWVGVN